METVLEPWLSAFAINLREFKARQSGQNRQGIPMSVVGAQKPSMVAKIDFFMTGASENSESFLAGSNEYRIADGEGASSGFDRPPRPVAEMITPAAVTAVATAVEAAVSRFVVAPNSTQKARGPVAFMQLNRLSLWLPFGRPDGQYVIGTFGAYADDEFTRQMVDAGMDVLFCTDEYIRAQFQGQFEGDLAALRAAKGIFTLSDFFGDTGVQAAIAGVASSLFTELKAKCDQWEDVNVSTIMAGFGSAVAGLAGAPAPTPEPE